MISINCRLKIDKGNNYNNIIMNLKKLAENGITKVVITEVSKEDESKLSIQEIGDFVDYLNEDLDKERTEVKLYPGGIVQANVNSIDEYLSNCHAGINGSSYVLLDIGGRITRETVEVAHNLIVDNRIPIISQPEMDLKIKEKSKRLQELIDMGCLFQLNMGSLNNAYDNKVKKNAKYLLKRDLYDFLECEDIKQLKKLTKKQRKEFIDKSRKLLNNKLIPNHKCKNSKRSIFDIFKRKKIDVAN